MSDKHEPAKSFGDAPVRMIENPEDSLPLRPQITGKKGYRERLTHACHELYKAVQFQEPERLPRLPKPAHIHALKLLLHSLAHVASSPVSHNPKTGQRLRRSYVAIPRRHDSFRRDGDYGDLSRTAFLTLMDALGDYRADKGQEPWLFQVAGYKDHETGKGRRTRVSASRPFLDWMTRRELIFPWHPRGASADKHKSKATQSLLWVSKRDEHEPEIDAVPLGRSLKGDETVLVTLNDALQAQRINFQFDNYAEYEQLFDYRMGRPKHVLGGNRRLVRQFSEEDGRAGRLFGHHLQRLPKTIRAKALINKQPIVELDYGSMQLVLLYALAGVEAPKVPDLYAIPGVSYDREDMKMVLTLSVGNARRAETLTSIQSALYKENRRSSRERAERLYDAFWGFHVSACPHGPDIMEPAWPRLQNLESRIALRVLSKLMAQRITAIPIHDSFIVQARHAQVLREAMKVAFSEVASIQSPIIKG